MALLQESDIRARAQHRAKSERRSITDSLKAVAALRHNRYDIFLSHTTRDAEIVLGVYDFLTEMGYVVFCDWIEAPEVNRSYVSPANAAFVRQMMKLSDTLLFLDTENADQSLWMCWELGWFDGENGHVGILPVLQDQHTDYRGREFLGLYPYVEIDEEGKLKLIRPVVTSPAGIAVIESPNSMKFESWKSYDYAHMLPRAWGRWRDP